MTDDTNRPQPADPARRAVLGSGAKVVALAAGASGGLLAGCGPKTEERTAAASAASAACWALGWTSFSGRCRQT
jgi:hypothetical protein